MKILFVSNDDAAVAIMRNAVDASPADTVELVAGISDAITTLSTRTPDVLLLDLELAEARGLGALARIQFVVSGTPIVVLTSTVDEATALRAVKAGAEDYVLREQLHGTLILRSLQYAVQRRRTLRDARLNAQLLSQVGQAVVAMSADGTVLSWNPAAERLFGWPAADVLGQRAVEFTGSLHRSENAANPLATSEMRLRRGTGPPFLAEVTRSPLTDETGAETGVIAIVADITQRRAAEQALRSSEQRLRLFVEQLPTVLWTTDVDLVITSALGAGLDRIGIQPESIIGRPIDNLIAELEVPTDTQRSARALAGESLSFDLSLADRWLNVHLAPLHDTTGQVTGTIGIALDVTESRRAEERHRRLIEVIEASPDYVATFDASGRVLYVNGAGRAMVGLRRAGLTDQALARFHPPDALRTLRSEALPHAVEQGTWTGESELSGTEGHVIPVWATIVAHRGTDAPVTFFSIVARDLTDRRRLEEQFRESQKMEAIGRLAGGVAHDFNNLLTAITGHTELLAEKLAGSDVAPDIDIILRAAERAAGLTRKLLAFSRRQVLQPKLLDINTVVTDMAQLLRRLIGTDITLELQLGTGISAIRADQGQLEQVVVHLVVNARDAMADGGRVELRTGMVEIGDEATFHDAEVPPGTYVEVVVADTGHGMEPSVISQIFEPFFTTREIGRGTGLGLPTVYGIVTQSGGHIRVESEPGAGSTFRVLLPAAAPPLEPGPAAAERSPIPHPSSETILLVEDEAAVRLLGVRILERRGYKVISASSGDEALRMFAEIGGSIQLLVTDVMMPGLSGTELARQLRELRPDLRVLFTSGYTADALGPEARLEPGMAFLDKPFTPDGLTQKVRELLDGDGLAP